MANTYSTSKGERLTTSQIDSKIRKAKALKLEIQFVLAVRKKVEGNRRSKY